MANKNNIRSIRFSDEMAELIDQQIGDTFTAKFESLITKCVWELPAAERRLEDLNMQIQEKRATLGRLSNRCDAYRRHLDDLERSLTTLSKTIAKGQEIEWET